MICGAVVSWMVSMEQRLHLSVAEERAFYIEVTYKYIMKLKKYCHKMHSQPFIYIKGKKCHIISVTGNSHLSET